MTNVIALPWVFRPQKKGVCCQKSSESSFPLILPLEPSGQPPSRSLAIPERRIRSFGKKGDQYTVFPGGGARHGQESLCLRLYPEGLPQTMHTHLPFFNFRLGGCIDELFRLKGVGLQTAKRQRETLRKGDLGGKSKRRLEGNRTRQCFHENTPFFLRSGVGTLGLTAVLRNCVRPPTSSSILGTEG